MAVVHGLQRNAAIIAIEVAILHEVLDGIDNLTSRGVSDARMLSFAFED
jgi:hypothetical protein